MKKLLILSITFLLTVVVYSQEKPIDKAVNSTISAVEKVYADGTDIVKKGYETAEKIAPKLEKALINVGTSLKVGADKIWNILVKQQLVWSWCYLLALLVTIGSWIHFWYRMHMLANSEGEDSLVFGAGITFCIAVLGLIISVTHFTDMLTGFINPEYGAMKTIAEIAQQIK